MTFNALKIIIWWFKIMLPVPSCVTFALSLKKCIKYPFKAVIMDQKHVIKRPKKVPSRASLFHRARNSEHVAWHARYFPLRSWLFQNEDISLSFIWKKTHVKTSYETPNMINLLDRRQDVNWAKNCSFLHNFLVSLCFFEFFILFILIHI